MAMGRYVEISNILGLLILKPHFSFLGDWSLDCTLDGAPLDHDGWSYAVDFPRQYYSKMAWTHCVRRRKWVRFRRYSALNSWCAIAPLHKDPTQEPFIGLI